MAAKKITVDALRKVLANHGGRYDRVLEKVKQSNTDFINELCNKLLIDKYY